jgi:hypothetical protein
MRILMDAAQGGLPGRPGLYADYAQAKISRKSQFPLKNH